MSAFTPTDEQELAVELFSTGRDLVVNAGAGTGKTSTLRLIGESTRRRGHYLAFNKSIVQDARGAMPGNVKASTVHSLAFGACGVPMKHRLNGHRLSSTRSAQLLDLDPIKVQVGDAAKVLQPGWLAGHVMRAVTAFCQSADPEPGVQHFRYMDGLDPIVDGRRTYANNNQLATALLPVAKRAWADLSDPDGKLRYPHDAYLKTFQLEGRQAKADFVLHDEAQDANPVTLAILDAQKGCQVIHVGDSQQAIYGWRGALDGMERALDSGAESCWLSQSFRFGPEIADLANQVLRVLGSPMELVGAPSIKSRVGPVEAPDAVLCRSNAAAVETVLTLSEEGLRPHLIGAGTEVTAFAEAAIQLQAGETTTHPELACFSTWGEVQAFVNEDPQGDELRMLVALIDRHSAGTVIAALDRMPPENAADVVVSTAHKAKGREWPAVRLAEDFCNVIQDGRPVAPEELRLLYVAVTRAAEVADVSRIGPLLAEVGIR